MKYYTISENDNVLIANNEEVLKKYYNTPIYLLPDDYEEGKYIIGEVEEEIEVIDYDEEGKLIGSHTETITVKKLIPNPDWEEEQAQKREEEFNKDFFNVQGYGYYRRTPKGYQSAVESMSVLFNTALAMNGIPENVIKFYQKPDFTKPEECTEEWLVEHQIVMPAMTKEQFFTLWSIFTTTWNTEEHVQPEEESAEVEGAEEE